MKLVRTISQLNQNDVLLAGGKGASLGGMTQAGIPIPPGFVILSDSFERFIGEANLKADIDAILHTVNHQKMHTVEHASEEICALILAAEMPQDIANEIMEHFKELDTTYVAVRSSATAEDSTSAAWAGQLESYLNTTEADLLEKVKHCWASLFTPRAIFYRFEKGLHGDYISVAVVVQKMVVSEVSGIAFSVHPVTEDANQLIIEAGYGLGEAIVSGQVTPDSYIVEKDKLEIIDTYISEQERGLFRVEGGGNEWKDIPKEEGKKQKLTNEEIKELAQLIIYIENYYGFPCDIEWAQEDKIFSIVQSRPITTLTTIPLKEDKKLEQLRPTVKRDLSLFSLLAWESGYRTYLQKSLGWSYPIFFHYDGTRVNFYHRLDDFQHFKATITPKLIEDTRLFNQLNRDFQTAITRLRSLQAHLTCENLPEVFSLIGKAMAFYIFIVSDSFVAARPEAWESRHLSEGILYELDTQGEELMAEALAVAGQDRTLAHFLTLDEFLSLDNLHERSVAARKKGYIVANQEIITGMSFRQFCAKNDLDNPEDTIPEQSQAGQELKGAIAYKGLARGKVVIIRNRHDINKVEEGDILVAVMTTMTYLEAIKKAAALVTDEGGVTCHAAIIAREMKKPCIIGTKIATQVLCNGDLVEVDATAGSVRRLRPLG